MKYFYALLMFVTMPIFSISYDQAREQFKSELFRCQQHLMKQDKYYACIEPYLQEAERTLIIPQYCKKNIKLVLLSEYFSCLVAYNVTYFNNYVRPSAYGNHQVEECANRLLQIIEKIKKEEALQDLDAQEELRKTLEIFQKANAAYYKALSFSKKSLISFIKLFR